MNNYQLSMINDQLLPYSPAKVPPSCPFPNMEQLVAESEKTGCLVMNRAKNQGNDYRDNDRESNDKSPFAEANFFTLRFEKCNPSNRCHQYPKTTETNKNNEY